MYVTNIPEDWTEETVRDKFRTYGHILSIKKDSNRYGVYAYVCFGDEKGKDVSVGVNSAKQAMEELDGSKVSEDKALKIQYHKTKLELERERKIKFFHDELSL